MKSFVLTCSDRAARGEIEDQSGPAVEEILRDAGFEVVERRVVPDERGGIAGAIVHAVDELGCRLVVTTGGTGIAERDVTPEATDEVTSKRLPGFGELMRLRSLEKTKFAPLSRAQAATRGKALVINLPGSRSGASESLLAVLDLIPHALRLLAGDTRH